MNNFTTKSKSSRPYSDPKTESQDVKKFLEFHYGNDFLWHSVPDLKWKEIVEKTSVKEGDLSGGFGRIITKSSPTY